MVRIFSWTSTPLTAQAMVTDGDGLSVGVSALIKRFHETGRLQSIDQQRRKLKVRRMIDGRRLEVLHLPADALELSITGKPGPIGPSTGAKNDDNEQGQQSLKLKF
jgi:hypothetical protein